MQRLQQKTRAGFGSPARARTHPDWTSILRGCAAAVLGIRTVSTPVTSFASIACDEPGIQTIVFTGRVHSNDPAFNTMHFRFAEMPSGYTVMTGSSGAFEVRVPRSEMSVTDLCALPTAGLRNSAFKDAHLSIEYVVQFER